MPYTSFCNPNANSSQVDGYVSSDGFVGAPVAPLNSSAPTFNPASFPYGCVERAATGITATPSGTQGTSVLLTADINNITTVATAGDGVKLPVAVVGDTIVIINYTANACNVFPNTGATINALAANAAYSLAANKVLQLQCPVNGKWYGGTLA